MIPISLALLPLMVPLLVLGLALAAVWRPGLTISALATAAAAAAVEAVLLWHLLRQVIEQTSRGTR